MGGWGGTPSTGAAAGLELLLFERGEEDKCPLCAPSGTELTAPPPCQNLLEPIIVTIIITIVIIKHHPPLKGWCTGSPLLTA